MNARLTVARLIAAGNDLAVYARRWRDFPTDDDVQVATAQFLRRPQDEDIEDTMRGVLEAVKRETS